MMERGKFEVKPKRQAYVVQIEGKSSVNGLELNTKDGLGNYWRKLEN